MSVSYSDVPERSVGANAFAPFTTNETTTSPAASPVCSVPVGLVEEPCEVRTDPLSAEVPVADMYDDAVI